MSTKSEPTKENTTTITFNTTESINVPEVPITSHEAIETEDAANVVTGGEETTISIPSEVKETMIPSPPGEV